MAYGLWLMAYGLWLMAYGLWLMGCDRVNQENFNKLEMGMKYNDVVTLLGKLANVILATTNYSLLREYLI